MYLITKEKFLQNLIARFPTDDMTVLDPFTGAKNPVTIRCNKCQHIYYYNRGTTLYSSRRKYFCPLCNSESVKSMVEACEKNDITIIKYGDNVTSQWPLHCNRCNRDFERMPSNWLKKECPYCGTPINQISKEQYQKRIDDAFGEGEFEILDEVPSSKRITVKHKCGFIRKTQPGALINSKGCPRCGGTLSRGEQLIATYLNEHNITFQSQEKLKDSMQRFDFFLPQYNLAIEFNGKQHYEPIDIFGGELRFKEQQEFDKKKAEYCQNNGIELFIISYKDIKKIDILLNNLFKRFNDQSKDVEEN